MRLNEKNKILRAMGLESYDFAFRQQELIHSNIRSADTKATASFAAAAAFSAYLSERRAFKLPIVLDSLTVSDTIFLVAVFILFVGAGTAALAIIPRTFSTSKSLTFWGSISSLASADEYRQSLQNASSKEIERYLLDQVYFLSSICARKFTWVTRSMRITALGIAIGILSVYDIVNLSGMPLTWSELLNFS
ncbi:Pycsar system effector family protein [Hyphomonas pacifica]|uniref:Pycsar system effector family protein n=1 Tax=Hyphomonas pacifica TaxID=1280941 RepID=UPI000DD44A26|nr:Pycsar system effector family protein [Hyphomonas pacifica]